MKFNWGTAIFLFFTVFIALCISFIVFALRQSQDLVENDYYEKGAGYTRQMEINKRSEMYRDSIGIYPEDSQVVFKVSKLMEAKVDSILVFFYRPSDKREDYKTIIKPGKSMEISKKSLTTGRYIVKLSWISDSDVYMLEKEISLK